MFRRVPKRGVKTLGLIVLVCFGIIVWKMTPPLIAIGGPDRFSQWVDYIAKTSKSEAEFVNKIKWLGLSPSEEPANNTSERARFMELCGAPQRLKSNEDWQKSRQCDVAYEEFAIELPEPRGRERAASATRNPPVPCIFFYNVIWTVQNGKVDWTRAERNAFCI